jgi:hypothetical protein
MRALAQRIRIAGKRAVLATMEYMGQVIMLPLGHRLHPNFRAPADVQKREGHC